MRFLVYKDGELAKDFVPCAAYMFGMDMIPLRHVDSIAFKEGMIECIRKSQDAAGLSLLWPVEGIGTFLLPTTRLPEREEPYILNLELARARLMQVTLKREDWALFEEMDKFADQAHEAQSLFISALQHISDPVKASVLADQALQKAMLFSEKLSLRYAEQYLALRLKSRGLGRQSLGCTIDLARIKDEQYRKWLLEMFSSVTVPVCWRDIETEPKRYNFSAIDDCMDYLADKRLAITCGPLLCFDPMTAPKWMQQSKMEFEKIREQGYEFVHKIVTRYGKYVHYWPVISGMNARNCFGFSYEQMIEMTRTACLAAKAADSKSRRIVEILYPWGEYYTTDKQTMPPLVYADVVIQSGISFDAFGLRMDLGWDLPGMHLRDLMQISSRLDCFLPVNKPLHITGAAAPCIGEQGGGQFRTDWSEAVQAEWLEQLYKIVLGRPFISSITYSQFADDGNPTLPGAGLLEDNLNPRKAYSTMGKFQKAIAKTLGETK